MLDDAITHLLDHQSDRVAIWQLLQLGASRSEAAWAVRSRGLRPGQRGVMRSPSVDDSHVGAVWEAILACLADRDRASGGPIPATAAAVHRAASITIGATALSALWAYRVIEQPPPEPQLLLPHDLQRQRPGMQTVRTRVWTGTVCVVGAMPSVEVVRALWDTAWVLRREAGTPARLTAMIGRADGLRLLHAEDLWEVACNPRRHGLPGIVPDAFRIAAFRCARTHSHSGVEHRARQVVDEVSGLLGVRAEPRPHEVAVAGARLVEVDIALPAVRVAIEIDGPHHDDPAQRRWDRRRDAWLRAAGWIVLRYPADLVDEAPESFRQRLLEDLSAAMVTGAAA